MTMLRMRPHDSMDRKWDRNLMKSRIVWTHPYFLGFILHWEESWLPFHRHYFGKYSIVLNKRTQKLSICTLSHQINTPLSANVLCLLWTHLHESWLKHFLFLYNIAMESSLSSFLPIQFQLITPVCGLCTSNWEKILFDWLSSLWISLSSYILWSHRST